VDFPVPASREEERSQYYTDYGKIRIETGKFIEDCNRTFGSVANTQNNYQLIGQTTQ